MRAFEVGKQHRDLLAFAFERIAGGENLLRQVGKGIRPWRPCWRAQEYQPVRSCAAGRVTLKVEP